MDLHHFYTKLMMHCQIFVHEDFQMLESIVRLPGINEQISHNNHQDMRNTNCS
jgi:hypothetical protein